MKLTKVGASILAGAMLFAAATPAPVSAIATAHPSVSHGSVAHPSVSHPSVSHPSVSTHTTPSISRSTVTHGTVPSTSRSNISSPHTSTPTVTAPSISRNSISHGTLEASRSTSASSLSRGVVAHSVASSLPPSSTTYRGISKAQSSHFYRSLNSGMYQTDYVFWTTYSSLYYTQPYWNYYVWMPYWLYNSSNHQIVKVKQNVSTKKMKWVKVGSKVIALPDSLYKKVKVGDTIELVDNTHIKINGQLYQR